MKMQKASLSIKFKLKLYFYNILFKLSFTKTTHKPKSIIILRTDAIGDYLLFCNFLKLLKIHFQGYHITFVGNIAYKDLHTALIGDSIDETIFICHKSFLYKPFYTIALLKNLKKYHYEILINPIYSRDLLNILIASSIKATKKYAPKGDDSNINKIFKTNSDRIYTHLFQNDKKIIFDFYRNYEFFSFILDSPLKIEPFLDKRAFIKTNIIKKHYCILFIGASSNNRKWSVESFLKVGLHLIKKYNQNIVICGGKEDTKNATKLQSLLEKDFPSKVKNLAGKTTLIDLGALILSSSLIISNETSCAHLSALLNKPVIVIYNGRHLGRFIPYPREINANYYPIFHPIIKKYFKAYKYFSNQTTFQYPLDIDDIKSAQVIKTINNFFKKQNPNF